jgi:coenzyme PQQ precursor peptide PqqA
LLNLKTSWEFALCDSLSAKAGIELTRFKGNGMNESTGKNNAIIWETPTFQEIPISFEASSYALIDEDDPPYR